MNPTDIAELRRQYEFTLHPTTTERAWVQGFFEGEGCVYFRRVGNGTRFKQEISFAQVDKAPLRRLTSILDCCGIGHSGIRLVYRLNGRSHHTLRIHSKRDVLALLLLIGAGQSEEDDVCLRSAKMKQARWLARLLYQEGCGRLSEDLLEEGLESKERLKPTGKKLTASTL